MVYYNKYLCCSDNKKKYIKDVLTITNIYKGCPDNNKYL